jgi:hypothetical protein
MEANGIDPPRFHFEPANVFHWNPDERLDVVLCLGLLYHVSRPVELLERCSRLDRSARARHEPVLPSGQCAAVRRARRAIPSFDRIRVKLCPTHDAVIDLCACVGYRRAVALRPHFSSWEGCWDFRPGARWASSPPSAPR